jgi:hypothetical protein
MTGRTGTAAPRSLLEICETAKLTSCTSCGSGHGSWCLVTGPPGIHLARFARARASSLLTAAEFASVIADADVFTGATVVRAGAA